MLPWVCPSRCRQTFDFIFHITLLNIEITNYALSIATSASLEVNVSSLIIQLPIIASVNQNNFQQKEKWKETLAQDLAGMKRDFVAQPI